VTIRASGITFPYSLGLNAYFVRRALIWFVDFLHYLQYYSIWFVLSRLINIRFGVFAHARNLYILIMLGEEKCD
jgi:hypothetical protein